MVGTALTEKLIVVATGDRDEVDLGQVYKKLNSKTYDCHRPTGPDIIPLPRVSTHLLNPFCSFYLHTKK